MMAESKHMRFEVLDGVDIYRGDGVLIKRGWLDYMLSPEYASNRKIICDSLNSAISGSRHPQTGWHENVVIYIENARVANSAIHSRLPLYDCSDRIRDIERQCLGDELL